MGKLNYLIFGIVNLAIFISLAVYFFRRPVATYIGSRSRNMRERRSMAERSLEETRRNYNDFYERLNNIDTDMKEMMDKAETEGEHEGARMLVEAEKIVDRVIEQSMTKADHIVARKNREFYADLVARSVKAAEERIRGGLDIDTQIALGRDFLTRLARTKLSGRA